MKLFQKLLGDGKPTKIKVDMESWRNLEYNAMCIALATQLRKYRETFELNQKDLANILGCNLSYVIRLESGNIDDLSIRVLIEIWTKLSSKQYDFGGMLMDELSRVQNTNYNQLVERGWI